MKIIVLLLLFAQVAFGQVSSERILRAESEPGNWLTYSGNYQSHRYSSLNQINIANVARLHPVWVYQSRDPGKFETSPIVVDGVLYITERPNVVTALDGRTGRPLWSYQRALPPDIRACCGAPNRGLAILGDTLFLGTLDAHLVALDMRTGKVRWDAVVADYKIGYAITVAPLAVKDKVIVGVAGGEYGIRGLLDAYDAKTGLYANSLVALNADTGQLKWYFQFTPHDVHDWDANQVPVLIDSEVKGRKRKLVVQANRNAFYYALDRETGEFLYGAPFEKQTWAQGLDARGKPISLPNTSPTHEGRAIYPGMHGATNWFSPSYNPQTKLFYVATREEGVTFYKTKEDYTAGEWFSAGGVRGIAGVEPSGSIKALEVETGKLRWEFKLHSPPWAGLLSTAGGLIFGGSSEGLFFALDAISSKPLWRFPTGGPIYANPNSFLVEGKQHVTIAAGNALFAFALD